MTSVCLLLLLAATASPAAPTQLGRGDMPSWYADRHAVLFIIDGLGDGAFDTLVRAGHLPKTRQLFVAEGTRVLQAASFWPGRGGAEATTVASGQWVAPQTKSLAPPGAEEWRAGSFAGFGADRGGLSGFLGSLPRTPGALPPVLAVVHDDRYVRVLQQHGARSPRSAEALASLDGELAAIVDRYQRLKLADSTAFFLVSSSGIQVPVKMLDANRLLQPLLPGDARKSARLATLLQAFTAVRTSTQGSIAFLALRQAPTGQPGRAPLPTFDALLEQNGIAGAKGARLLEGIASADGVMFVIAREKSAPPAIDTLQLVSRAGRARLDVGQGAQYRYTVVSGRDPLALGRAVQDLGAGRFHAAGVWRAVPSQTRNALERIANLLKLEEEGVLAVVAKPGVLFDDLGLASGPAAQALMLHRGLGRPADPVEAMRGIDVSPSLLALVGAPLDPALDGEVVETWVDATSEGTLRFMCREMVRRATGAFSPRRSHDATVIDTTEVRRFGVPPAYFAQVQAGLAAADPLSFLPEEKIQQQIGARRSMLRVATDLSHRVEALVLKHAPNEIRRFDPLIRPEFILAGFLDDPAMRSRIRVLEGPIQRAHQRAAGSTQTATP